MKSPAALTAILCLSLLLTRMNGPAADDSAADAPITWLPLTQDSPPTRTDELRGEILSLLEPLRQKVFGDPEVILSTAFFVELSPTAISNYSLSIPSSSSFRRFQSGISSTRRFLNSELQSRFR